MSRLPCFNGGSRRVWLKAIPQPLRPLCRVTQVVLVAGRIDGGQTVAERILEGDRIERMEVLESTEP